MNSETVALLAVTGVVLSSLAVVLQTVVLFILARAVRDGGKRLATLSEHWETQIEELRGCLMEVAGKATEVGTKASEVLELTRSQLGKVDVVLTDATSRAKVQMDRVELVVDEMIDRIEEISLAVNKGVLRPVREVNGVLAGIQAALGQFIRGQRATVAQATQDDEMFI